MARNLLSKCAQTGRQRLLSYLNRARDARHLALIAAEIAAWNLTAIDAATFGVFNHAAGTNMAAITATETALTSVDLPWTAADVGRAIHVAGAGAGGATLATTIAAYVSPGAVTLADAAGTTVAPTKTSPAGIAVWGDDASMLNLAEPLRTPAGDTLQPIAGIAAAIAAAAALYPLYVTLTKAAGAVPLSFAGARETVGVLTAPGAALTVSTAGLAAGRHFSALMYGDGADRGLTWPATWRWVSPVPATLPTGKVLALALSATGATDADVIASAAVEA